MSEYYGVRNDKHTPPDGPCRYCGFGAVADQRGLQLLSLRRRTMIALTARSIIRLCGAAFCLLAHAAAGSAWAADPALPYGINAHLPSSAQLDRVAAAGIAWIRVDFNWFMLEPARGVYDWTLTDAVVSDARARGLNVYA